MLLSPGEELDVKNKASESNFKKNEQMSVGMGVLENRNFFNTSRRNLGFFNTPIPLLIQILISFDFPFLANCQGVIPLGGLVAGGSGCVPCNGFIWSLNTS